MPEPVPIVLIEIDENSRLQIRQEAGVRIIFIDYRVENDHVTVMPERADDVLSAIAAMPLISPKSGYDDWARTAVATLQRIAAGRVIVAKGPGR